MRDAHRQGDALLLFSIQPGYIIHDTVWSVYVVWKDHNSYASMVGSTGGYLIQRERCIHLEDSMGLLCGATSLCMRLTVLDCMGLSVHLMLLICLMLCSGPVCRHADLHMGCSWFLSRNVFCVFCDDSVVQVLHLDIWYEMILCVDSGIHFHGRWRMPALWKPMGHASRATEIRGDTDC